MNIIFDELNKINFNKELEKDKLRFTILIFWEITLMIGVAYIQYILRPQKLNLSTTGIFLQGTLPSLFGASGYLALFFVFHKVLKSNSNNYKLINSVVFAFLLTFGGLTFWELIRTVIYPFDFYDIIMTFLGCLISLLLISVLYFKDLKLQT